MVISAKLIVILLSLSLSLSLSKENIIIPILARTGNDRDRREHEHAFYYAKLLYYTMHFIKLLMAHYSRVYTLGNSTWPWRGRGGGQVVSVLAYLSGNPRSNPAEV